MSSSVSARRAEPPWHTSRRASQLHACMFRQAKQVLIGFVSNLPCQGIGRDSRKCVGAAALLCKAQAGQGAGLARGLRLRKQLLDDGSGLGKVVVKAGRTQGQSLVWDVGQGVVVGLSIGQYILRDKRRLNGKAGKPQPKGESKASRMRHNTAAGTNLDAEDLRALVHQQDSAHVGVDCKARQHTLNLWADSTVSSHVPRKWTRLAVPFQSC